jgi:hypothetical protein
LAPLNNTFANYGEGIAKPKRFSAGHWLQGLRTVKQVLPLLSILSAKEVAWILSILWFLGM